MVVLKNMIFQPLTFSELGTIVFLTMALFIRNTGEDEFSVVKRKRIDSRIGTESKEAVEYEGRNSNGQSNEESREERSERRFDRSSGYASGNGREFYKDAGESFEAEESKHELSSRESTSDSRSGIKKSDMQ